MALLSELPSKLTDKINLRSKNNSLRIIDTLNSAIDFYSNDYLGFAQSQEIFNSAHHYLMEHSNFQNGSTGSRLLSGNHSLFEQLESQLAKIHDSQSALVFNSGYAANLGLLSTIPQKNDTVLYDKLCHASMRDGIRLSHAKAYGFKHNDLNQLEKKLIKHQSKGAHIYILTESVFSMDGDSPDLNALIQLSEKYQARVIIDEAHAFGVFGYGLVQTLNLQKKIFARVITFGKALGCHGAVVLGSHNLKVFLSNFARPFIYTTAMPPIAIATIIIAYKQLNNDQNSALIDNIKHFRKTLHLLGLNSLFIESFSAIQCCLISGNERVKSMAQALQQKNFAIKPILSPTVILGQERLRFCLHSFNTENQITTLLTQLKLLINQ